MKHQQNKDLKTPDYYKNNSGEDLFTQFKNGLMKSDEFVGFLKGNAFKYLQRYNLKDQKESDLYKLKDYVLNLSNFIVGTYGSDLHEEVLNDISYEISRSFLSKAKTKENFKARYKEMIFNRLTAVGSNQPLFEKKKNMVTIALLIDELIKLELGE